MDKLKIKRILKKTMFILLGLIALLAIAALIFLNHPQFGKLPSGERLERIEKSRNYRDGQFQNQNYTRRLIGTNPLSLMIDFMFAKKVRLAPEEKLPSIKTELKKLDKNTDILVWLGHSSYYIQIKGRRFLVDPVFSEKAGPAPFGVKAFKGTNIIGAGDIPEIDYLILTHDHWDHLDYSTLKQIKPKVKKIITALGVGSHLEYWEINPKIITELDWYEGAELEPGFSIMATPARHFSGRGLKSDRTLWASFALLAPELKLFIGGDGGYDSHFEEIGAKYGPFDLAIIEQGQYDKRWRYIHLMPEEAHKAASELRAKSIFPVHNSKFTLAAHPWDEPLEKLSDYNKAQSIRLITPMIGEKVFLRDTAQIFSKWWKGIK